MKNFTLKQHYVILLLMICLLIIFFCRYVPLNKPPFFTLSAEVEKERPRSFVVEIAGGVENPGIYCFEQQVDLGAVIKRAGGLTRNVVPAQKTFSVELSNAAKVTIGTNPSSLKVETMEPEKRFLYFIPINVNTAQADELVVVPGIGDKTASAIVQYRQRHGNFLKLDELKEVSGIGDYKFMRWKRYLTI
jgi:competence protein ComEA